MNLEDKVELISYLAFVNSKMTRLSIELWARDEDTNEIDRARAKLSKEIDNLRADIAKQWSGRADHVMADLRRLNSRAQEVIRGLDEAADKAGKVTKVLNIFDKGLNLVKDLVLAA